MQIHNLALFKIIGSKCLYYQFLLLRCFLIFYQQMGKVVINLTLPLSGFFFLNDTGKCFGLSSTTLYQSWDLQASLFGLILSPEFFQSPWLVLRNVSKTYDFCERIRIYLLLLVDFKFLLIASKRLISSYKLIIKMED